MWTAPGIVTAQSIKSTDCRDDYIGTFDFALIVVRAGVPVTIGMERAGWTPFRAVYGPFGQQGQSETGSFSFTPQADGLYGVLSGSATGATGNYTLSISAAAPSASIAASTLAAPRGERSAAAPAIAIRRGEKSTVGPAQALRKMVLSPSAMRERHAARMRAEAARASTQP